MDLLKSIMSVTVILLVLVSVTARAQTPLSSSLDPIQKTRGAASWDKFDHRPIYTGSTYVNIPLLQYVSSTGNEILISASKLFPAAQGVHIDGACGGPNHEIIALARLVLDKHTVRSIVATFSDDGKLLKVFDLAPYMGVAIDANNNGDITVLIYSAQKSDHSTLMTYDPAGRVINESLNSHLIASPDYFVVSSTLGAPTVSIYGSDTYVWLPNGEQIFHLTSEGGVLEQNKLSIDFKAIEALTSTNKGTTLRTTFTPSGSLLFEWAGVDLTNTSKHESLVHYLIDVDPKTSSIRKWRPAGENGGRVELLGVDSNGEVAISNAGEIGRKIELYSPDDAFAHSR